MTTTRREFVAQLGAMTVLGRTIEAQHQFHKLNTYGHLDFVHPAWDR